MRQTVHAPLTKSGYFLYMSDVAAITAPHTDYGVWTDYHIPDDRSGWHLAVRQFYDYWLGVTPPGRLLGRQHIAPEGLLPRAAARVGFGHFDPFPLPRLNGRCPLN